ncbi:hypothetical protein APV28_3520 [Comamonas testosteroni]|nr:hypothetical protein APV28_3520 [Comamonas testosteroni]
MASQTHRRLAAETQTALSQPTGIGKQTHFQIEECRQASTQIFNAFEAQS